MSATIDSTRAQRAREIYDAALRQPTPAVQAWRATLKPTGVFPNAFAETTSDKYADICTPREPLTGEALRLWNLAFTEGVEDIEPEPFVESERWTRSYTPHKIAFAHLPLRGYFTDGELMKVTKADRAYYAQHPITLDQSRTLPAPTLTDKQYEATALDKTNARRKGMIQNAWLSMQQTAGATQRTYNYRTLTDAQLSDFSFTPAP
jgi:hypothetical protein